MNQNEITKKLIALSVGLLFAVSAVLLAWLFAGPVKTGKSGARAEVAQIEQTAQLCADVLGGGTITGEYSSVTVTCGMSYVLSTSESGCYVKMTSSLKICPDGGYYTVNADFSYKTPEHRQNSSVKLNVMYSAESLMFCIEEIDFSRDGGCREEFEKVAGRWVELGEYEDLCFEVLYDICPVLWDDLTTLQRIGRSPLMVTPNFRNNDGLYTMRAEKRSDGESPAINPLDEFARAMLNDRLGSSLASFDGGRADTFYTTEYDGSMTVNLAHPKKPLIKYGMAMDKSRDSDFVKYSENTSFLLENINCTTVSFSNPLFKLSDLEFLQKIGRDE